MINLTNENKELCFADSTLKPLMLFMYYWVEDNNYDNGGYWQYLKTLESEIVLESAEFEEGILDSNNFELGSFVVPTLSLKWRNDGMIYKDMLCIPVQKIGTQYIAYFNGSVIEQKISNDGITVDAKIVANIYNKMDKTIMDYFYPQTYSTDDTFAHTYSTDDTFAHTLYNTLYTFWNVFVDEEKLKRNFANANQSLPTLTKIETDCTLSQILKQAGEFLGGHIKFITKRVVDIEELKQPITTELIDEVEFVRISVLESVETDTSTTSSVARRWLSYCEFTGQDCIVTTDKFNNVNDFTIELTFIPTEFYNHNAIFSIGSTTANEAWIDVNGNFYIIYNNVKSQPIPLETYKKYNIKLVYEFGYIYIYKNNQIIESFKVSPTTVSEPFVLFNRDVNYGKVKFFSCKITQYHKLISDIKPVLHNNLKTVMFVDTIKKGSGSVISMSTNKMIYPTPIETFILPYHINAIADKNNNIDYRSIILKLSSGLSYSKSIKPDNITGNSFYEISNNSFFEELTENDILKCLSEVGSYLAILNFYNSEVQSVYAPFVEVGDYLIAKNRNSVLPKEYEQLDYIVINGNYGQSIDTGFIPENGDSEFIIEFEPMESYATIFESGSAFENSSRLGLYFNNTTNKLQFTLGYDDIEIMPVLKQKKQAKITLKSKRYIYDYFSKGIGNVNSENTPFNMPLILGGNNGYKLYHFQYNKIVKGVNILDPEMYYQASDKNQVYLDKDIFTMSVTGSNVFINRLDLNPIVSPKGQYTVTIFPEENYEDFNIYIYFYNKFGGSIGMPIAAIGTYFNRYSYSFTANEDFILSIGGAYNHLYDGKRSFKVCLEKGKNTQPTYVPYTENKEKVLDMYPCIKGTNVQTGNYSSGVYDIVSQTFFPSGDEIPNEIGRKEIIIPVLSATARGIHSMRADILCKATNSNKN